MKKAIISIFIILLLTSCKEKQPNDNTVQELTKNIMIEKETIKNDNPYLPKEELEPDIESNIEEPIKKEKPFLSTNDNITKNEINKEQPIQDNNKSNEVDAENDDFNIHQGIIDCKTIDACMEMSLPIQFELKNSIDNIFYLEVKDKNQKPLGYYIEYHFKNYKYDTYDTCIKKSEYLNEKISDRINNYNCKEDGTLIINEEVTDED